LDTANESWEAWDFVSRECATLGFETEAIESAEEERDWDVALPTCERQSVERRASVSREQGPIRIARPARRGKHFAVLAILGAAVLGVTTQTLHSSFAAHQPVGNLNYHWQSGYYLDNGWLCYGWPSGAYHCTAWWHKDGGTYVSDNPAWVPHVGQGGVSTTYHPASAPNSGATGNASTGLAAAPRSFSTSGQPCAGGVQFVANISQWTVPPGCYSKIYYPNPANYVYRAGFGWCNWWPEVLHPHQPDLLWGSEYTRSSVPAVGAAIFFSGDVQGASSDGHYAEVVAISPDHYWVLVSEMNFYWRGGGWQKVDYRYIHVGWGVTFIYP
jgi:hypothetical protein